MITQSGAVPAVAAERVGMIAAEDIAGVRARRRYARAGAGDAALQGLHVYARLDLFPRINVLVYLNPEWDEADGGCLELFEPGADQPTKVVVPQWGTCVISQ